MTLLERKAVNLGVTIKGYTHRKGRRLIEKTNSQGVITVKSKTEIKDL